MAPRIDILFVLDRNTVSVRDFFIFKKTSLTEIELEKSFFLEQRKKMLLFKIWRNMRLCTIDLVNKENLITLIKRSSNDYFTRFRYYKRAVICLRI